MNRILKFLIRFGLLIVIISIIAGSVGAGILYAFYRQLPYISLESYRQSVNSRIVDEEGRLILELFKDENRTRRVKLIEVSKYVTDAIISIEDRRFYNHYGVDFVRILKSLYVDIKERRKAQGASTITQQLARNAFLTLEKKWSRKIKETMLAFKLEHQFTKQEILELYINEVPFGEGSYGIESASQIFFGKSSSELVLHEAALLAGAINAPTAYSPFRNYDRSITRRNIVLRAMLDNKVITEEQFNQARESVPELVGRKRKLCAAPYYIYSSLLPELREKYGESIVMSGGLTIQTTINKDIQQIAEEEFAKAEIFERHPELNGAVIVLEVKTGKMLAIVGGKKFEENDQYNRAFNALRQPGSMIKPIIYLAAFDNGIPPNKIFSDVPREYFDPWTQTIWQPKNYEGRYHGPVILRMALENSYNIVAIELLKEVGIRNVIEYARKGGINSRMRETLSFALGTYEATPVEVAQVFSTFANSGVKVDMSHIIKITDHNGIDIENNQYSASRVFPATSTAILNDCLEGVVRSGSGTRGRIPGYTIAGKTGTTDEFSNAWFCGYTPNLLVVSYFGYDYPRHIEDHASGGRIAAPVVKNIMERIFKKFPERFPPEKFIEPENMVKVNICRESGLTATDQCQFKIEQIFHAGTEPKMNCNFHDPFGFDMSESGNLDMNQLKDFFTIQEKNTMLSPFPESYNRNTNSEVPVKNQTPTSLDKLKNELKFFETTD